MYQVPQGFLPLARENEFFAAKPTGPQFFVPPSSGVAANGKPIFSWNQAAAQIASDDHWNTVLGTAATITYAYRSTAPSQMPSDTSGFQRFSTSQIVVAEEALALWSEMANITFTRAGVGTSGEAAYSNNATILLGDYTSGQAAAAAFAFFPGSRAASSQDGDVWVNISLDENQDMTQGTYGPQVIAHELGHAIGLDHPGPYNAGNGDPTYATDAVYYQDTRMYSIMSYWGSVNSGGSLNAFSSGPQLHDIAAIQLLYGANLTTRTGDTIYGFNSNTGHEHFTIHADGDSPVFAIWDAGGNDTLDLSGFTTASEIDLREEAFSSAGPGNGGVGIAIGNISIARGAVIENAIGGNGADTIIGNGVANSITGNGGNDTLSGGLGFDTANYAAASTAATWTRHVDGSWTVATTGTFEGNDTVTSVEYLHFADRDVHLANAWQTFSGDGTSDILLRHSSGALGMWFVNGGSATGAGVANIDPAWTIVGSADFDGDGRDDLFMRHSSGSLGVWFMNGATAVGAAGIGSLDSSWSVGGLGDFNGDTKDDILLWNANGSLGLWLMNGAVATGSAIGSISQSTFDIAGIGDLNGDGRDDILWRNTGTGDVGVWFMNGAAATGAGIGNIPLSWAIEGLGDFNGDGRDDILLRDASGNLGIWFMNGASATGAGVGNIDHTWSVAGVGDYNGDGKDDILWWNDNGSLGIWFMNGAAATGAVSLGAVTHDWIINPGG